MHNETDTRYITSTHDIIDFSDRFLEVVLKFKLTYSQL